tara:strand:- start:735 stop:968 length:234 start_codon:yes stop_codon:yes gene_type:complete
MGKKKKLQKTLGKLSLEDEKYLCMLNKLNSDEFLRLHKMKQIEIGINVANEEWEELASNSKRMFIIDTTLHVRSLLN